MASKPPRGMDAIVTNEKLGAERGSRAYQVMKKPATGTGRAALNAAPFEPGKRDQKQVSKQGSRGRPPLIFGQPARGLTKGYAK